MDWCKFLVFDIQMKRMNMYHLFQNTTKLRIGYDDPPNQEIFNCMQYEIPELSETGYVVIKSPNEIEIFKTEDSPSETLTQRDTTANNSTYWCCKWCCWRNWRNFCRCLTSMNVIIECNCALILS